ncbi:MAG: hypothetical protein JW969_20260 [Spirochaetales bacterium]|nr:hypothetical protein [Spirochaetales bacterium]
MKKRITGRILIMALGVFFLFISPLHAELNMTLGGYGGGLFSSIVGPHVSPVGSTEAVFLINYRDELMGGNSFIIDGKADFNVFYGEKNIYYSDSELINMSSMMPLGWADLYIKAKIYTSLFGVEDIIGSFFNPEVTVKILFGHSDLRFFTLLKGAGRFINQHPDSDPKVEYSNRQVKNYFKDDILMQGIQGGMQWELSRQLNVELSAGYAFEGYLEDPVWLDIFTRSTDMRHDHVLNIDIGARGLFGYGIDWNLDVVGTLRFSNGNLNYEPIGFEYINEKSDDSMMVSINAGIGWQINESLFLKYLPSFSGTYFLGREAITEDRPPWPTPWTLKGEKALVFNVSNSIRFEWMIFKYMNFMLDLEQSQDFANDMDLETMNIFMRCGIEYSF